MLKPLHVFAVLAPILTIGAWFWMDGALDPPEPLTLGFKIALSLLLGVVPAALIALFWTMGRGLFIPKPSLRLGADEQLIGHAAANHRVGAEMRGGRIFVSDRAIHFVPHRFNVQLDTVTMLWDEIRLVDLSQNKLGSKLVLHSQDGEMDINLAARSLRTEDFRAVVSHQGAARVAALQALRFTAPEPGQDILRA